MFDLMPRKSFFSHSSISCTDSLYTVTAFLDGISVKGGKLTGTVLIQDSSQVSALAMEGTLQPGRKHLDISFYAPKHGNPFYIPYIKHKLGLVAAFDSLHLKITESSLKNDVFSISTIGSVAGLLINHPRISLSNVELSKGSSNLNFNIGSGIFEIDSTSTMQINAVKSNIFFKYNKDQYLTEGHYAIEKTDATAFFNSFPNGLFDAVKGMEAKGKVAYHMNFKIPLRAPRNLIFNSDFEGDDLQIIKMGEENLRKINGSFAYTAYEKGQAVKTFVVGPESGSFSYLAMVPDNLKNAVLNSEDGSFFGHRGFNEEAFKSAMAENIEKKRFVRGGSTISMQLVKNVFLSRNKTVARKAEEAMLVWLIENLHLSSKARMLEVYFNIIEWGPMVYGINQAANFYFAKSPQELNLAECLYLASIIPRPKKFMWSFDNSGHLREYVGAYYQLLSGIMLRKGQISESDYNTLDPYQVQLKGPAKSYLKIATDTLAAPSEWETY